MNVQYQSQRINHSDRHRINIGRLLNIQILRIHPTDINECVLKLAEQSLRESHVFLIEIIITILATEMLAPRERPSPAHGPADLNVGQRNCGPAAGRNGF